MASRILIVALVSVLSLSIPALAWGPHPDIAAATFRVLPKDNAILVFVDSNHTLANSSWIGDFTVGCMPMRLLDLHTNTGDFSLFPGSPGRGHPQTIDMERYGPIYHRVLQALHTESPANATGWLGLLMHYVEDSGAPPHAANISGQLHTAMENWVDAKKIDIAGYEPKMLGKTLDEAIAGCVQRTKELDAFAKIRAEKLLPLAKANDRPACEPLVLECANESARALADVLHTLAAVGMTPPPNGATLIGKIDSRPAKGTETFGAKIMIQGTTYSTLADAEGNFKFRNIPAGEHELVVMRSGSRPARQKVTLEANKEATVQIKLAQSEPADNLLRNDGLTVKWYRTDFPEEWWSRPLRHFDKNADRSLTVFASDPLHFKAPASYKLVVKWKKDVKGQARIVWDGTTISLSKPLVAPDSSMSLQAPQDAKRLNVLIDVQGDLADAVESVALIKE